MQVTTFSNPLAGKTEGQLYDYAVRLERLREKRRAVHIHISRLQSQNRRDYNMRIATHVFDYILGQHEGELFILSNGDFVFIAEGVSHLQIERSLERLRTLFNDDPLIYSNDDKDPFCTWYELETDYDKFLAHAKSLMNERASFNPDMPQENSLTKLGAKSLADLEDILDKTDISSFVRNQPVCFYMGERIETIFDELYVSIPDLQRAVLPKYDLRGNKWLFQYLTEVLDRRMLTYLRSSSHKPARMVSVNMNISTILSNDFQLYDNDLTTMSRGGNLVIEVQKHDVFADMGAYLFACDYLHERTHKICLDGITHLTLPCIDRQVLKLDLVKLCWSPEMLTNKDRVVPAMRQHIKRIGAERFILIHCDAPEAVDFGREVGISMFQGRYVTHMLLRRRPQSQTKAME